MLERDVEKILVKGVRDLGGKAYKFTSPGNDGVPDRLIVLHGLIEFVELKQDNGRLSPLQRVQISKLESLGASVRVLQGEQDVRLYLDVLRKYRLRKEVMPDEVHST
mgnify:CR=1 FL=1